MTATASSHRQSDSCPVCIVIPPKVAGVVCPASGRCRGSRFASLLRSPSRRQRRAAGHTGRSHRLFAPFLVCLRLPLKRLVSSTARSVGQFDVVLLLARLHV